MGAPEEGIILLNLEQHYSDKSNDCNIRTGPEYRREKCMARCIRVSCYSHCCSIPIWVLPT